MVSSREPLEDDELKELLRAADDHGTKRDRMFIHTLAFVGLRASALAHMTKDWMDFQRQRVVVPPYQPCSAGRNGPCSECRKRLGLIRADPSDVETYANSGDTWAGQQNHLLARAKRFERYARRPGLGVETLEDILNSHHGMWFPKSGAGHRPIPVRDDNTWEILTEWFDFHDDVMVSRQTIGNTVTEIARRADISRKVEPHELRHTYGTRLAAMDFSPYEIKDAMGHATTEQAEDYVKIAGKRIDDAFSEKWEGLTR